MQDDTLWYSDYDDQRCKEENVIYFVDGDKERKHPTKPDDWDHSIEYLLTEDNLSYANMKYVCEAVDHYIHTLPDYRHDDDFIRRLRLLVLRLIDATR